MPQPTARLSQVPLGAHLENYNYLSEKFPQGIALPLIHQTLLAYQHLDTATQSVSTQHTHSSVSGLALPIPLEAWSQLARCPM